MSCFVAFLDSLIITTAKLQQEKVSLCKDSEQPSPRILGFFRARARALFRSSWSDRARAVTRAQLLKNFHAYNDQLVQKKGEEGGCLRLGRV